jgi:ankyrin repeat protein
VLGRDWTGDPNEPGGPREWAPLVYVTHSCFASAGVARELLERGADPNSSFAGEHGRMSALYGAAGRLHDPELTRVLLEAGADPDDGESLYHATEAEDPDCLRLLLEHGAATRGTNALAHALDDERLAQVRALLEAGADPNEGALLAHAVRRGRGPEYLRLLVEHGAELDTPGGETWRGDAQEVLILAALRGRLDAVVDAVGTGFCGVVGGSPEGTLLHHAAWVGDPDVVRELLARGADPLAAAPQPGDTPLAWAAHGSQYWELPGRDYAGVAELLVAGGAPVEPRHLEVAEGPLYGWLERH